MKIGTKHEFVKVIREKGKKPRLVRIGDIDRPVDSDFDMKVKKFLEKEKNIKKSRRDARVKKFRKKWGGVQKWISNNINQDLLKNDLSFDFDDDFDMFGNKKNKKKDDI